MALAVDEVSEGGSPALVSASAPRCNVAFSLWLTNKRNATLTADRKRTKLLGNKFSSRRASLYLFSKSPRMSSFAK